MKIRSLTNCSWLTLLLLAMAAAIWSPVVAQEEDAVPETARDFMTAGSRLLAEGQAVEAVEMLEEGVKRFPGQQALYYYLAGARFAAGDPEAALAATLKRKELTGAADLEKLRTEKADELLTTVSEVLERHIEAIGGRSALTGVKTMTVDYTGNSTHGAMATIRRYYKRPGYFRQEVVGRPGFTATDGATTWRFRDGEWRETGDVAYQHLASIDNFFLDYEQFGVTYEFVGLEIFSDTPVYHLERTCRDGHREDLYFSEATGLMTEMVSEYPDGNPMMISAMSYWDYRDVGGIKIPHVFIRNVGELGTPHGGVVQEVRINEELGDDLFLPPQEDAGRAVEGE